MKKLNETFRNQEPMRQPKVRASWPNSYVKGVYIASLDNRHESHYQSYHITSVSDIGNTTVMRHF